MVCLGLDNAKRLLSWLARLHSVAWEDDAEVTADFFPTAGAQSLDKRDPKEIEALPEAWAKVLAAWPDRGLPETLGARLSQHATRLACPRSV